MTITRSTGLAGVSYMGKRPGGGYSGATAPLDQLATDAAKALEDHFHRNVVIRFNSDRRSGKAWVVTDGTTDFWANSDIGVGGRLVGEYYMDEFVRWTDEVKPVVLIKSRCAKDLSIMNNGLTPPSMPYFCDDFDSLDEALAFCFANARLPGTDEDHALDEAVYQWRRALGVPR